MDLLHVVQAVVDHLRDVILDAGLRRLVGALARGVLTGARLLVGRERHQRHGEDGEHGREEDDHREREPVLVASDAVLCHTSDLSVTFSEKVVARPVFVRTMNWTRTWRTALAVVVVAPFLS